MPVTRSALSRKSARESSNGDSTRNDHHDLRPSAVDMEMDSQQAHVEELKAEVRLLEKERDQVSWLFEALPAGYVLLDENGFVHEFNRQIEKLLGFRQGVLSRGPLARLVVQADVPKFLEHLRVCRFSQQPVTSEIRLRNGKPNGLPVEMIS